MRPQHDARSALVPWPAEVDPDQVRQASSKLIAHVSSRVDPDGAIREDCRSRVLESALALTLMTRAGVSLPARDRVLAFLRAHLDTPFEFDRVLATLAVAQAGDSTSAGDSGLIDKLTEGLLGAAPEFISARRRRMLYAVLSVLGCPLPPGVVPAADEEVPTDPIHSWAAVQQASVTLILAGAAGVSNSATAAAMRTLDATRPATTVWEGYVLLHLLSLHALAGVQGQEATVRSGVETLVRHQRDDGGFPFVTEMQNWCTSTAAIALAAAGSRPGQLWTIAKSLAAHRVDASQRELSRSLSRGAALSDGWSIGPNVAQNDVDCTSCVVEFLQGVDPVAFGGAVRRGVDGLLAVQNSDGGFPTYVAGASSEPCMTAAAVNALAPHPSTAPARERALAVLADSQLADGGFEPGWSRSRLHTMFRARLAAHTADPRDRRTARMAERIEGSVYETQNPDGGWGMQPGDPSDDISTAYALITLSYGTESQPVGRALSWLLAHQNADGGYGGPPDMVGPRPFSYHLPILTDIPVLLAFGHVRARVQRTAAELQTMG
ncbi:prenyltransferase/squalene oxidase repeat-containing protein [Streptomyces sp. NPDC049040]|uniref:prenyltransferase/squalene oxidase repeat-containing protein n=1 Tax=Streptomyces sp. NPDC049040 TaxID=3365593 RepID=UPI0037189D8D